MGLEDARMNRTAIAGRSVLVTGGSGFLGCHVVSALEARRAGRIIVPRSASCDLTDAVATRSLFERERPEIVLHLAAHVGGIGANRRQPGTFFRDNALMGIHVVEECRRLGVQKLVLVGTVCAYPKFAPIPFRENDLWNGYPEETNAPYGVAKKSILVMAQAYRQEFGLDAVTLFPVNLYGPRDNFDLEDSHVIPAMIRKFVEARISGERHVTLWGDGSPTREFLYVDDAADAIVLAAERYDSPDPVNVGAGFEIRMRDLAEKIGRLARFTGEIVWDTTRPNGQPRRMLDTSRARERFGFTATTTFDAGLAKTIGWYEANREDILRREAERRKA